MVKLSQRLTTLLKPGGSRTAKTAPVHQKEPS